MSCIESALCHTSSKNVLITVIETTYDAAKTFDGTSQNPAHKTFDMNSLLEKESSDDIINGIVNGNHEEPNMDPEMLENICPGVDWDSVLDLPFRIRSLYENNLDKNSSKLINYGLLKLLMSENLNLIQKLVYFQTRRYIFF